MEPHEFVRRHPRLFHLAHTDAWPGIERHGLLSSARLVSLFGGDSSVLTAKRPESMLLEHPEHGSAVLRDQKPLSEERLVTALDGMTVAGWIEMLNGFVFLFPSEDALLRTYGAYDHEPVVVLTIDTAALLSLTDAEERVRLASHNTGYTMRKPKLRGRFTFKSIAEFTERAVKEVVIADALPETMQVLVSAERWTPDGGREWLFQSEEFVTLPTARRSIAPTSGLEVPRSWTIRHFTQGNPQGEGQSDVAAMLRRVAGTLESMGEVQVQDLILNSEVGLDGEDFPSITVYFQEAD